LWHGLAQAFADLGVLSLHRLGDRGQCLGKSGQEVGVGNDLGLQVLPQGKLGSPHAKQGKVGPGKSIGPADKVLQVHVVGEGHAAGVNSKDLVAGGGIRYRNIHQRIEAPWPQERRVDEIRPVRSPQDDNSAQLLQAIQLGEELVHDPLGHMWFACRHPASRHKGIHLVEEHDGGGYLAGLGEELSNPLL